MPFSIHFHSQRGKIHNSAIMAVTPLTWEAFDNFTKFYNLTMWTTPIMWDSANKKLIYNKLSTPIIWDSTKKKLIYNNSSTPIIPWVVAVFGFSATIVCIALILLLLHFYGGIKLSLIHGTFAFLQFVLLGFGFVGEIVCLKGSDFVNAFNCLTNLYLGTFY
jgi:hypothetical protein